MDDRPVFEDANVLRLQLELHLDREPISGRLRTPSGAEERFVGWLGFVDALRRLQQMDEGAADP
ncbi:MAG TPA: hypothetical protein VIX41_01275 [Acidimicrobiales bacterium]